MAAAPRKYRYVLRKICLAGHRIIRHVSAASSAVSAVFGGMEGRGAYRCFSPAAEIRFSSVPPLDQHGLSRADQLHTAYDALHFSRNFAGAKRLHAKNGCRHAGFASAAGLYHRPLHHGSLPPPSPPRSGISRQSRRSSDISGRRQSCKTSLCPKSWNPRSYRS